ncbi:aminotransferase class I/II-fold pyridoxal phosphate-dependent enzyme [Microbacterium kribbense]|uniref:cysteine-S-conjugate beta-lyase n=1 Tax=Microbacterium kribbense TaxID=433645 RepID=A0ABP7G1K3_9MICO
MTSAAERFDQITVEQLRRIGGMKWSRFPEAIGAFVAEMDFGVAPVVHAAIQSAVDAGLHGYLPTAHQEAMQAACGAWQRERYGWEVPSEWVRPLGDVLQGMRAAIEMFTEPGSAIVVPTPAYMPFLTLPAMTGREVMQVPMRSGDDGWSLDLDGIDRAFAAGGGMLVFCNPHNPIGKVYSRAEMSAVAEIVQRHGARVFADEIHAPLVFAGAAHVPYAAVSAVTAGHTITATSASKAWNLPGLKCAQVILSNEQDAATWTGQFKGFYTEHGAGNLGVIANTAAYSAGGDWLGEIVDYLEGNRRLFGELVAEHLPGVRCALPEGTYLAWLDCRSLGLGDRPAEFFQEQAQVVCTDGAECGDVGAGHLRFNFATPRPILCEAVGRMGRALAAR